MKSATMTPTVERPVQERHGMNTLPLNPSCFHHMTTASFIFYSGVVVTAAAPIADGLDTQYAILTLGGTIVSSAMAWALNRRETFRVVFGKFCGAMLAGVGGSRLAWNCWQWARDMVGHDPIIMWLAGAVCGLVGYALAAAVVRVLHKRAEGIVEARLKSLLPNDMDLGEVQHAASDKKHKHK